MSIEGVLFGGQSVKRSVDTCPGKSSSQSIDESLFGKTLQATINSRITVLGKTANFSLLASGYAKIPVKNILTFLVVKNRGTAFNMNIGTALGQSDVVEGFPVDATPQFSILVLNRFFSETLPQDLFFELVGGAPNIDVSINFTQGIS